MDMFQLTKSEPNKVSKINSKKEAKEPTDLYLRREN